MIGAIADDVTGGTDVAVAFHRRGLRTALYFGMPSAIPVGEADAVVVALKTRTVAPQEAVRQSLQAADLLLSAGSSQLYFKYCSTFDSTARGNIGPVLDALAERTGVSHVVTTPSSPEHGRTVYDGILFVDGAPLADSPMRDHPLTPMRESSLTRLLDAQSVHPDSAVIALGTIRRGVAQVRSVIEAETDRSFYLIADALEDADLMTIARAAVDDRLVAGAAGLAGALAAANAERDPSLTAPGRGVDLQPAGPAVVLAGSCSHRTLEQLDELFSAGRPAYRLDALMDPHPESLATSALRWMDGLPGDRAAPVIYSSLPPERLIQVQSALGVERSSNILETAMGLVAAGLAERGVTRFVAAGGETSGSVVAALGIQGGTVGVEAAQGVPWIHTPEGFDILLKSGNFGDRQLLVRASDTEANQ